MKAKKPGALTLVDPASTPNPLAPPASLGKAGRKLWQSIHSDFVVEDASGLCVVQRICEATDTLAGYDEQIARDGVTIRTAAGLKEHPLLKHQLATRSFIVRSLHRLGFDIVAPRSDVGRPAGDYRGEGR